MRERNWLLVEKDMVFARILSSLFLGEKGYYVQPTIFGTIYIKKIKKFFSEREGSNEDCPRRSNYVRMKLLGLDIWSCYVDHQV